MSTAPSCGSAQAPKEKPQSKLGHRSTIRLRSLVSGPLLVAFSCLAWSLIPYVVSDNRPAKWHGPAVTYDESFNVQQGVYLIEAARIYGLGLTTWEGVSDVFLGEGYLPDHPPLGRLWLGLHHQLSEIIFARANPQIVSLPLGRLGAVTAFALTVWLWGHFCARWHGPVTGTLVALSIALTPRLVGHASLAALETVTNLAYSVALLSIAHFWVKPISNAAFAPSLRAQLTTGIALGLLMLTKIQFVLLIPAVVAWSVVRFRQQALIPLLVWGLAGFTTFFIGWPWLWLNPAGHLKAYFLKASDRVSLNTFYLGEVWADKAVPWHYPLAMVLVTVPLGLLFMAAIGAWTFWQTESLDTASTTTLSKLIRFLASRPGLMLCSFLAAVGLFMVPGIAVYDGERLFLPAFLPLAYFIGNGLAVISASRKAYPLGPICAVLVLVSAGWGVATTFRVGPVYYNLAGQQLAGRWLESSYWGEGTSPLLLQKAISVQPKGQNISIAPVLHQFQLVDLAQQYRPWLGDQSPLVPYTQAANASPIIVVNMRLADLPRELWNPPPGYDLIAETVVQGRPLARCYRNRSSSPQPEK